MRKIEIGNMSRPMVHEKRELLITSVLIDRGAPGFRFSRVAAEQMDTEAIADQLAHSSVFAKIKDILLNPDALIERAESFLPSKNGFLKTKTHWFVTETLVKEVAKGYSSESMVQVSVLSQILIELFGSLGMIAESREMYVVTHRDNLFPTLSTLEHEIRKNIIRDALEKVKFKIPMSNNRSEVSVGALSALLSPILIEFSNNLNMVDKALLEFQDSIMLVRAYITGDSEIFQSAAERDILNDEHLKVLSHNFTIANLALVQVPRRPTRSLPFWEGLLARTKSLLGAMDRFKWERAEQVRSLFSHTTVRDAKGRLAGCIIRKNVKETMQVQAVYPVNIGREMNVVTNRSSAVGEVLNRSLVELDNTLQGSFISDQLWSILSNVVGSTGTPMGINIDLTEEELLHYAVATTGRISIARYTHEDVESSGLLFVLDAAGLSYFPASEQLDSRYVTFEPMEAILVSAPDGYVGTGVIDTKSRELPGQMMNQIFLHHSSDKSLFMGSLDRSMTVKAKFRAKVLSAETNLLNLYGLASLSGTRFVTSHSPRALLSSVVETLKYLYTLPKNKQTWDQVEGLNDAALRRIVAQVIDNIFGPMHKSRAIRELAIALFDQVTQNASPEDQKLTRNSLEKAYTNFELRLEAMRQVLVRTDLMSLDDADFLLSVYREEGMLDQYAITTFKEY